VNSAVTPDRGRPYATAVQATADVSPPAKTVEGAPADNPSKVVTLTRRQM
jgi:hypothetical protein